MLQRHDPGRDAHLEHVNGRIDIHHVDANADVHSLNHSERAPELDDHGEHLACPHPGGGSAEHPVWRSAFVRFFVEQINPAWTTPDPSLFDGLYATSCTSCQAFRDTAASLKSTGRRAASPVVTVSNVETVSFSGEPKLISLTLKHEEVDIVDADDKRVRTTGAGGGDLVVSLTYSDNHWIVNQVQVDGR